jgi:phosphohistidine phosphatase
MNLYIIRHADAGNRDEWRGDDADRPLSDLGHRQARALGEAFQQRKLTVGAVVSSPLVRTRETAAEFLGGLESDLSAQFSDLLAPAALKPRKLSKHIAGLGVASVAVVGHDPDLPEYLGWLLGADPETFPLAKAGAALVTFDGDPKKGDGHLAWMITPDWFMTGSGDK